MWNSRLPFYSQSLQQESIVSTNDSSVGFDEPEVLSAIEQMIDRLPAGQASILIAKYCERPESRVSEIKIQFGNTQGSASKSPSFRQISKSLEAKKHADKKYIWTLISIIAFGVLTLLLLMHFFPSSIES